MLVCEASQSCTYFVLLTIIPARTEKGSRDRCLFAGVQHAGPNLGTMLTRTKASSNGFASIDPVDALVLSLEHEGETGRAEGNPKIGEFRVDVQDVGDAEVMR
jgi:hypothetical protein